MAAENYGVGTITKGYDDCIKVAKKEVDNTSREGLRHRMSGLLIRFTSISSRFL